MRSSQLLIDLISLTVFRSSYPTQSASSSKTTSGSILTPDIPDGLAGPPTSRLLLNSSHKSCRVLDRAQLSAVLQLTFLTTTCSVERKIRHSLPTRITTRSYTSTRLPLCSHRTTSRRNLSLTRVVLACLASALRKVTGATSWVCIHRQNMVNAWTCATDIPPFARCWPWTSSFYGHWQ